MHIAHFSDDSKQESHSNKKCILLITASMAFFSWLKWEILLITWKLIHLDPLLHSTSPMQALAAFILFKQRSKTRNNASNSETLYFKLHRSLVLAILICRFLFYFVLPSPHLDNSLSSLYIVIRITYIALKIFVKE